MSTSVSHDKCQAAGHHRVRHSPDGFNIIEECHSCMSAWQIQGITGEITKLADSWMVRVLARERELSK